MKQILVIAWLALAVLPLSASTNAAPVKLAIISESPDTVAAADLLTAEFSKNTTVQLLERTEIEKLIREQQLSLNNLNRLKLGQMLGADGLLALQILNEGTNQFLSAQLVAVRPGVLLADERFNWPLRNAAAWSQNIVGQFDALLPKLNVLAKDAIPISVVNFHAAVQSSAASALERQLSFLVIERLAHEKSVFVLERKRMQSLSEEKERAGTAAEPFWNGKYLLDGTIDRDGSLPDLVSISARLVPPGGQPILIEATGSRTNYTEVANQLVKKVLTVLKINSDPAAWNTADEANKFFQESQWCLAWGMFSQARLAAEAAWALGKHDAETRILRVRTFMPPPDGGFIYYPPREKPNPEKIDDAIQALRLYQDFSRNLPVDEPKLDSDWYKLGLDNLKIATRVLQQFNWSPEFYQPVANTLAELRAEARSLAELLSRSPSVRDGYFVGDRVVKYDKLYHFEEKPSIYGLKLERGCLWQERPEDEVALYLELMSSPVFRYLHERFWFRDADHSSSRVRMPPRLVAWNEADQKRLPEIWNRFVEELKNSPDVFLQMEARALRLADIRFPDMNRFFDTRAASEAAYRAASQTYDKELASAFTDFFDTFVTNRLAFRTNNVDVLYLNWGVSDLVERMGGDIVTPGKELLQNRYKTEYSAKLAAKEEEINKHLAALKQQSAARDEQIRAMNLRKEALQAFEKQKQFLKDEKPFDWRAFGDLFNSGFRNYSKTQAEEIKPLLATYKRHLSEQQAQIGVRMVEMVEANIERILNPEALKLAKPTKPLSPSEKLQAFEQQKAFLKASKPFDPQSFVALFPFGFKDYSKAQAEEILPMLAEYKKNLSGSLAQIGVMQVGQIEANVERIINPATATTTPPPTQIVRTDGTTPPPGRQSFPPNRQAEPATEAATPAPLVSTNIITINNFYPIPLDEVPGDKPHNFKFTDHRLIDGRLLLDFQYNAFVYSFDAQTNWQSTADKTFCGVALFDPVTAQWQVAANPAPETLENHNVFPHRSTLWQGVVYASVCGHIFKLNPNQHELLPAGMAVDGNYQLFALDEHFYVSDYNTIQEITDHGRSTRILTSIQRNPPVSSLDSQGALKDLALFTDADKSLCAAVHKKVFRWDGADWQETGAVKTSFQPSVFEDGVLFMTDGFNLRPAQIFRLEKKHPAVELCLSQPERRGNMPVSNSSRNPNPQWKLPAGMSLPNLSAALQGADLLLMTDHSEQQDITKEEHGTLPDGTVEVSHVIIGKTIKAKDGYNSALYWFTPGLEAASLIHLQFDNMNGCPPMAGLGADSRPMIPQFGVTTGWMLISAGTLFCGREQFGGNGPGSSDPPGFKPGIWMTSAAPILSEVNRLKKEQAAAQAIRNSQAERQAKEAEEKDRQARQAFLEKYDTNHNGLIDGEEKEAALADEIFIESELPKIDVNQNGLLDSDELIYFDANTNRTLDANALAGIETAQRLLAAQLLHKFDADGDGFLNQRESDQLMNSGLSAQLGMMLFPDNNHDGKIDVNEVQRLCEQITQRGLAQGGPPRGFFPGQMQPAMNSPSDANQLFKQSVDRFWQSGGTNRNRPSTPPGFMPPMMPRPGQPQ